jgi:hypothetical protein
MLLVEAAVQRLDVSNIFFECFARDVEERVTICLNGLGYVSGIESRSIHLHGVDTRVDGGKSCLSQRRLACLGLV